jgi:hypothetical protein
MKFFRILLLSLILLPALGLAQDSDLLIFLKSIPGAEIENKNSRVFSEYYVVMLPQLVDHRNPNGPTFKQRIYIGHFGFDRPTVMETEGYGAEWVIPNYQNELSGLLNANMIYVEHRYFGASIPNPLDWQYLNAEQDAGDYHYIRQLFGQRYPGKWLATGVSKGGQTATEFKVFYPDDVDVTVPYVAPINFERLDPRIDRHFTTVGTWQQRERITAIQMYLFENKKKVIPVWEAIAEKAGLKFTSIDAESAFDYSVLEFPFSFWQYTADENKLPDPMLANPESMARYLYQIVNPFWYTDAAKPYEAANYQFYTQLGYYEYDETPFRKYLKNKDYPNSSFVPKDVRVEWDPSYQEKMKKFFDGDPKHMIYIYGEADPWGATSAPIRPDGSSLKMIQKGGTHGAQISTLSPEQQKIVRDALEKWLDMKIN